MRYFLCWICPPLALLSLGKPFSAIFNTLLLFTLIGIPFCVLWAVVATRDHYADRRNKELISAMRKGAKQQTVIPPPVATS